MTRRLLAATLVALAPSLAFAQEPTVGTFYGPGTGGQEFTLSGTGSNDNDFNDGSFGVTAGYGRFLTDNIEIGLRQTINWANVGDEDSVNATSRLALDYVFNRSGRWQPFLGANVGYTYGDGVSDTGIIGPELGLKYYVNTTTFIYGQTEYQYFFDSGDEVTDNFDDGAFVHTLGIGFNF